MSNLEKIGLIVSNKMEKSVVVEVSYRYRHPVYSKIVIKTKRYMAHDENNQCDRGDKVILQSSRPLSKRKRWVVKQILNKQKEEAKEKKDKALLSN